MISLLNNVAALVNHRTMAASSRAVGVSLEHLSTGKQINRASDDPAGMIAVENFRGREKTIHKQIEGLAQEDAFIGAREGAQRTLSEMLIDLQSLVTTAANRDGQSPAEREALATQAGAIVAAFDDLANTTRFKSEQILSGFHSTYLGGRSGATVQTGRVDDQGQMAVRSATLADLARGGKLNLFDGNLESAQKVVDAAAQSISASRASLGARSKAIADEMDLLQTELLNVTGARSQIEDADFAQETAELMRNQTLQQAQVFMAQLIQDQIRSVTTDLLKPLEVQRKAA